MIKLSVNETKWSSLLSGPAFLFFIFWFEYLVSGLKSYWDFRETGPRIPEMLTDYRCGCYLESEFCQKHLGKDVWLGNKLICGEVMTKAWDVGFLWKRGCGMQPPPLSRPCFVITETSSLFWIDEHLSSVLRIWHLQWVQGFQKALMADKTH